MTAPQRIITLIPEYRRWVAGVPGQAERRFRRRRSPGLNPGRTARRQLGDNFVGDFLIKPRPVLAGAGTSSMCLGIADLRDGRSPSLSRQPSTRHG